MDFTTILLTIIFLILFPFCVKWYLARKRIYDAIEPLNGEKWYPFIGTTLKFIKTKREHFHEAFVERNKLYGPLYRTWTGFIPGVHVMKAEHVEPVLRSSSCLTKAENYKFVLPWLGRGLITSKGAHWKTHRRLITPTFHFSILDSMTEIFSEKGQALSEIIDNKYLEKYFDIYKLLSHCELEIICETAMGVKINAMSENKSDYARAVYEMSELVLHRMFNPHLHPDFIFYRTEKGREHNRVLQILHDFSRKVIQERKEKLLNGESKFQKISEEDALMGKKQRKVFLDLLLENQIQNGQDLSDEEIREEVDTFMFAGHDTSTVTISWTLLTLSNHPDIQKKVQQELDDIFQGEDRPVTPQDVAQMQYLERVVKESQRLIPIVPVIGRRLDKDLEIAGRIIPKDVMIVVHLEALHKDPEQFPDPEVFDPDRFLPENCAKRHPYSFVPFSAGPRNCLGQKFAMRNVKVLLATLLRRYNVKSEKKIEEMKYNMEITLRPQGGLNIWLEKRNK